MLKKITNYYKRPLVWDTINTTFWSTIGRGVGFLIPFFIAAWFGVSSETDAFFFAYGIILFLSGIFAPVVESVIVPYIAEARANGEDVGKFVGNILSVGSVGLLVLTALLLMIIHPILSIVTHFDDETLKLVCLILVEASPLIIFLVWTSVLSGALNTYKKFTFPAISPAFRALVNLGVIFAFKNRYGVHSIAFGYVVGEIARLFLLWVVVKQLNLFKLCLCFRFNQKLKEFLKTASYQVAGMAAVGLNPIVDKTMASWLYEGSISVLYYADRLYMVPTSLMIAGLFPVISSHWSEDYYGKRDIRILINKTRGAAKSVFGISMILFLILLFLSRPAIHIIFAKGKLDPQHLFLLWRTFVFFLLGLIPYVVGSMFARGCLVLKRTKFLSKIAFLNIFIHVVLNYILMKLLGISGIALSNSITILIVACLLFVPFRKNEVS